MRTRVALALFAALTVAQAASGAIHDVTVGPGNAFVPDVVNIAAGDTVRWTRAGGYHRVVADDGSWQSPGGPVSWGVYTRQFNSAGNFEYYCDQHSSPTDSYMNGVVNVTGGGGGGGAGSLRFSGASASVSEGAGQITLTVQRTDGDDGAVSVQYSTSSGSASAPGDFTAASGTLNWADNDDNNKTFNVQIADDGTQESSESFTVTLQNAGGGASVGSPATVTVTINDDDGGSGPGTIRFSQASTSVGEGAGTVTLVAQRTGGTTGAVGVSYATAPGTAGAPGDYTATSSTLSWGNGDGANKSFTVAIANDSENEPDETFTATLSSPTGGASLGSPSTATVTINDNDTDCVPSTCTSDSTSLCLAGGSGTPGRFRIRVTWTDFAGGSGQGVALPYTPESGFFYFFQPSVLELLVKIVNGCGLNDSYWFFNAAASNVGLVYTVTDLQTCETRTVNNPVGTFASGGNINFFENCP